MQSVSTLSKLRIFFFWGGGFELPNTPLGTPLYQCMSLFPSCPTNCSWPPLSHVLLYRFTLHSIPQSPAIFVWFSPITFYLKRQLLARDICWLFLITRPALPNVIWPQHCATPTHAPVPLEAGGHSNSTLHINRYYMSSGNSTDPTECKDPCFVPHNLTVCFTSTPT